MGAGASATAAALEPDALDAPELTLDDVCAWVEAQPSAVGSAFAADFCARVRSSGCSAAQLLLAMDRDELFDVLGMQHAAGGEDARKLALALVRAGREALRHDFRVTLKQLPDAMDKAVYVLERFPLVVDAVGGQATRFLKYQRGSVLMVGSPSDMAPESLRRHLVGALKHGTLLVFDFDKLSTIELEQFFSPETFPREVLSRQALFSPSVLGRLLRPDEGDPDPSEFAVNDQFKLVVVCQTASPPPKTALAMCVLHVHLAGEHTGEGDEDADGANSSQSGRLAKILGVGKEVKRNSVELVEAAFDGDLETVTKCLDKGYDLESEDGHAHTALSEAACQGNNEVLRFLLVRGADPNKCNDERRSPLYRAAYNGHYETAEILLASGADLRIHTKQAEAAFDVAKTPEIRELLAGWDLTKTDRLLDERQRLIEAKWQERIVSHVEREQFALLQIHQEILELARKGDASRLEAQFELLADESIATGEWPRASADIRDEKGSTLLAIAAQHDHLELVSLLLTKWKVHREAAQAASFSSSSSPQQQLAKRLSVLAKMMKPNVNARDCRGWTPVSIAVFHEAKRSLRVLLDHGADPKLKNQYNKNAFDFARDDVDAATNIVKSRAEIRQVLVDWENERRVVATGTDPNVVEATPEAAGAAKKAKKKGNKELSALPVENKAAKSPKKAAAPTKESGKLAPKPAAAKKK